MSTDVQAVQPAESSTAISVIPLDAGALLTQAVQQGVPAETMERLLAMRADLQAEQARVEFSRALSAFQADIPAIQKSKTATVKAQSGAS
jgi:hypothetical protein